MKIASPAIHYSSVCSGIEAATKLTAFCENRASCHSTDHGVSGSSLLDLLFSHELRMIFNWFIKLNILDAHLFPLTFIVINPVRNSRRGVLKSQYLFCKIPGVQVEDRNGINSAKRRLITFSIIVNTEPKKPGRTSARWRCDEVMTHVQNLLIQIINYCLYNCFQTGGFTQRMPLGILSITTHLQLADRERTQDCAYRADRLHPRGARLAFHVWDYQDRKNPSNEKNRPRNPENAVKRDLSSCVAHRFPQVLTASVAQPPELAPSTDLTELQQRWAALNNPTKMETVNV